MITSTSNPQIKRLVQLQKKSKVRDEENVFVVEGLRMFAEVPINRVEKVYISETLYNKKKLELNLQDFPHEILSDSVFLHVSDTKTPQGILCIVKRKQYDLSDLLRVENPHFMVLDNLQDPGNMGTIVRTAEGAGVDAVFMSKDCVDISSYLSSNFSIATRSMYHCAYKAHEALGTSDGGTVRVSLGVFNTLSEIKILLYALKNMM